MLRLATVGVFLLFSGGLAPAMADILWGVNGHPLSSYPGTTIKRQIAYVRDLGLKSYRVDVSSLDQLPRLIELVRDGKANGIEILPVIAPSNADLDKDTPKELYDKAFALAVGLIEPLKADVRVWELGNEMEVYAIIKACEMRDDGVQYNCAWGPAGGVGPLEYFGPRWTKVSGVLKGLSDGAISVDPAIRKAMGTAGWGHTGAFARMRQDGIQWDISVWHMYGEDPEWAFKILAEYKRPIWVTEFNNPYGSIPGEAKQAEGLLKTMTRLRQLQQQYKVEVAHVYELMDESYWEPSFEARMGLVRLLKDANGAWMPGNPKIAYETVKDFVRGPEAAVALRRACDLKGAERLGSGRRQQVSYSYCLALNRAADGGGLEGWTQSLGSGSDVPRMLAAMIDNDEFAEKHGLFGLGNRHYVRFMVRLLIDREPDAAWLARYAADLDAGTRRRDELAREIVASAEFRARHPVLFPEGGNGKGGTVERFDAMLPEALPRGPAPRQCDLASLASATADRPAQVAYAYCLGLGRAPDGFGLNDWVAFLQREPDPRQMLLAVLDSDEHNALHGTASLNNSDYVVLVYRLLLDRDPDADSLSRYGALLDGGSSRAEIRKSIVESSEFASRHLLLAAPLPSGSSGASPQPN